MCFWASIQQRLKAWRFFYAFIARGQLTQVAGETRAYVGGVCQRNAQDAHRLEWFCICAGPADQIERFVDRSTIVPNDVVTV